MHAVCCYSTLSCKTQMDPETEQFQQNVIVMRHGDRKDNFEPLWASKALRPWDPPLVENGKVRAFRTGLKLREIGFPIHRVFVSPFLRCIETAYEVVSALCAVEDVDPAKMTSEGLQIDSSKVKVSVEFGLCEMLNILAIRSATVPKNGNFGFKLSECEDMLPAGTVDRTVERVYEEMPKWDEYVEGARSRYRKVMKDLADKYPKENLLLVTHGEGVGVAASTCIRVETVEYCGYSHAQRPVTLGKDQSFTAGEFKAISQTGIR